MSIKHEYMYDQRDLRVPGPVTKLQLQLISKGFSLPKFGADGHLGNETWTKLEAFAEEDELDADLPVPEYVIAELFAESDAARVPPNLVRVKGDPADVHGMRPWRIIDTVVLHQTGIFMSDNPHRFRTMNAHIGILKQHATSIVQVQDLRAYMHHANRLNRRSVGLEINGKFPGLAKDYDPDVHTGMGPTNSQIADARTALIWVQDTIAAGGGRLRHILPHRVSSSKRRGDPGEVIWKEVGVWAQDELGLTDIEPGYTIGSGRPTPFEWDPRAAYKRFDY